MPLLIKPVIVSLGMSRRTNAAEWCFSWSPPMMSLGKKLQRRKTLRSESSWRARCIFSNYVRDLAVALEFVCAVLSRSAAPQKDRRCFAFLQQLVNTTLCPAEQKKGSSPCPVWLACRSHCPRGRSEEGALLVKKKKTSRKPVWNIESYFRRQSWWLLWPSMGQDCIILPAPWGPTCFAFWSYWDMDTTARG